MMDVSSVSPGHRPPRYGWMLAAIVGCFYAAFAAWPQLSFTIGLTRYGVWFLDTFAILASNDALARGLDPYANNALDYFGRPHVYSHWWLWLGDLGLTRAQNFWLGLSWVVAFGVAVAAFFRPRTWGEVVVYAVLLCSPPVMLAVERGNNDLVVFILLAGVVPCLLSPQRAWRWLAVLWIALAAGLKYYPAVAALVVLAGGDRREVRWRVAFMLLALLLVGLSIRHNLADVGRLAPKATGFYSFGASAILEPLNWNPLAVKATVLTAAVAVFAFGWRLRWLAGWTVPVAERRDYLAFVLGAALLSGCFWTGMSFGYRWIFALWMAPWLWRLAVNRSAPVPVRRLGITVIVLLFVVTWGDALLCMMLNLQARTVPIADIERWAKILFLSGQAMVWPLFGALAAWLAHFVRQVVFWP